MKHKVAGSIVSLPAIRISRGASLLNEYVYKQRLLVFCTNYSLVILAKCLRDALLLGDADRKQIRDPLV